jgi:hypothetical protein
MWSWGQERIMRIYRFGEIVGEEGLKSCGVISVNSKNDRELKRG